VMVAGTSRLLVLLAVTWILKAVNVLLSLVQLAFVYIFHLNRYNWQCHDYFGYIDIFCLLCYCLSLS
jgi:hypothetical protein